MMKYVFILFPALLIAQPQSEILFLQKYQKATLLNGTSQAWSSANSTSLNLDGNDAMIVTVAKTTGTGEMVIVGRLVPYTPLVKMWFLGFNSSKIRFRLQDGVVPSGVIATSTNNWNDGKYHLIIGTIDRDGNATIYVDGVSDGSASIAALAGTDTTLGLGVGARSNVAATWFNGNIGAIQIVKYSALPTDIASVIKQIANTWQKTGLPSSYTGGNIIASYDWKSGGFDKSGNGNHLYPAGNPTIVNAK